MDASERRKNIRVGVRLEAKLASGTRVIDCVCENVSAKGLYLATAEKLPLGTECHFQIFLGDPRYHPSIKLSGEVVRADGKGLGIEVKGMTLDGFEHLKNIIIYSASDPDRAEAEFKSYLGLKRFR